MRRGRRRGMHLRLGAGTLLVVAALSGCGARAPRSAARFNDQSGNDAQTCLLHQRDLPDVAYAAGQQATTILVLDVLHYYVANGNKPYCDGRPPSAVDRAWLQLYLHLGADPSHIARYAQPPARSMAIVDQRGSK